MRSPSLLIFLVTIATACVLGGEAARAGESGSAAVADISAIAEGDTESNALAGATTLAISELSASIAASNVHYNNVNGMAGSSGGNIIEAYAFSGATGIVAITMNSGANAIAQQAVTTHIDRLALQFQ